MTIHLKRLSTEYIDTEDRIRLSGETAEGEPVVIWMTNRLAGRAVPTVLRWLENQVAPAAVASPAQGSVLQSFAQEAAVAGLKRQQPVAPKAGAPAWLAKEIEIVTARDQVSLTFRGLEGQSALVRFRATHLRQWLSILHFAWSKAQWPDLVWPGWIKRESSAPQQIVLH